MAASDPFVLTFALATTGLAAVLPWLQREEALPMAWERKAIFWLLLVDAVFHWSALVQLSGDALGPGWQASAVLLMIVNLGWGLYLVFRGFPLPPVVRWVGVAVFLVQPVLLLVVLLKLIGRFYFV